MSTLDTFALVPGNGYDVRGSGGASWPPPYHSAPFNTIVTLERSFWSGTYTSRMVLLRWDTSSIPVNAVIVSARVRLYRGANARIDSAGISLAGDWYNWTPPAGSSDYAHTAIGTAFSAAVAQGNPSNTFPSDTWHTFDLADADANVNRTGYTGLRVGLSGTAPAGAAVLNTMQIYVSHGDYSKNPVLEVEWELPGGETRHSAFFALLGD